MKATILMLACFAMAATAVAEIDPACVAEYVAATGIKEWREEDVRAWDAKRKPATIEDLRAELSATTNKLAALEKKLKDLEEKVDKPK